MKTEVAVRLNDVSVVLDGLSILKNISFDVHPGEFVAIVGPSGCGKTTLLKLICGQQQPEQGIVTTRGTIRRVYQQGGLLPWLTVRKNIELGVRSLGSSAKIKKETDEILDLTQMRGFENFYPHQLSGGMRQRTEVARAVSGHGDILLLDEPFSAIDYLSRLKMREELSRLLEERPRTVILVTHEIEEAVQLADRVLILNERPGTIVSDEKINIPKPRKPASTELMASTQIILDKMGFV